MHYVFLSMAAIVDYEIMRSIIRDNDLLSLA